MPVLSPFTLTYRSYYSDGTSSLSTLSDDLMRTKIIEEEENGDLTFVYNGAGARRPSTDRQSSIGGISSNDSLWGDARRLSEAGVRRTSDTSVVLTEDTDGFIIGDRVWVGGTRPGQIAYIGETQFGPGDWAGIVLDQAIGKNDGSVGGIRYFQCEPKRGVFSRLGRLTREALVDPPPPPTSRPLASSTPRQTTPPPSAVSRRTTPPPTPASSRPLSQPRDEELRIGDRVIVKSGGASGSKAGILRFRGEVRFKPGVWCGVELDEPLGKNDGSVEGFRYFICPPSHGLFAPAAKVSKSPVLATQKPSSCVVHGKTPSLRRSNSRESINSTTSSVRTSASITKLPRPVFNTPAPRNPVQQMTPKVKPRDDQVEELLKERDLIRTQMIKAAELVETSEKKMLDIRVEFDMYKSDMDLKVTLFLEKIKKLEEEKTELFGQLEDVQFRAEEETIYKSDIQVTNQQNINKIMQLEAQLEEERKKVDKLSAQSNDLFVTEEELIRVKDELERVRSEMGESLNVAKAKASLMEQEYDKLKNKLTEIQFTDADASEKSKNFMNELEALTSQLNEKTIKILELESCCSASIEEITRFKKQVQDLTSAKESLTAELSKASAKESESLMLIQTKNKEFEDSTQACKQLEKSNVELLGNISNLEKQLVELQSLYELSKQMSEKNKTEAEHSRNETVNKLKSEIDELKKSLENYMKTLQDKERELSEDKIKKDRNEQEFSTLKKDLEELKNNCGEKDKLLSSKGEEISKLSVEIQTLKDLGSKSQTSLQGELNNYQSNIESLTKSLEVSNNEIAALKSQLTSVNSDRSQEINTLNDKLNKLEMEKLDLIKESDKMKVSIKEMEEALTKEKEALIKHSHDLREANKNLLEKEFSLENNFKAIEELKSKQEELNKLNASLKQELQSSLLEKADTLQQLKISSDRCQELSANQDKLKTDISTMMNTSSDSSEQLSKLNYELRDKEKEFENFKSQAAQLNREMEGRERALQMEINALVSDSQKQLQEVSSKLSKADVALVESNKKVSELNEKLTRLQTELEVTAQQLQSVNLELEFKTSTLQTTENSNTNLKTEHDKLTDEITSLRGKIIDRDGAVETLTKQLNSSKENEKSINEKLNQFELKRNEADTLSVEHNQLTETYRTLSEAFQQLKGKHEETEKLSSQLKCELSDKEKIMSSFETDMKKSLQQAKTENDDLKAHVNNSNKKVTDLETLFKEQMEKSASLTSELEALNENNRASTVKDNTLRTVVSNKVKLLASQSCLELVTEDKPVLEEVIMVLDALNVEMSNLKKNLSEKVSEVEMLSSTEKGTSNKLLEKQKERDEMEKKSNELSKRVEELSNALTQHEETSAKNLLDKENMCKQLENEVAEKLSKVEELSLLIKTLQADRDNSNVDKKLSEELQNTVSSLKESLNVAIRDKGSEQEKHSTEMCRLTGDNDKLKSSNEGLQLLLDEQERHLTNMKFEKTKLEEEVNRLNRIKEEKASAAEQASLEVLRKSNQQLESKLAQALGDIETLKKTDNKPAVVDNKPSANKPTGDVNSNTFEDREFYETQVKFLNSIIFDLKNKNDVLNTRIQQLESYQPEEDSGEERKVERKRKAAPRPPRLFCDICDEFDLHETEDCPQQASSDSPPRSLNPRKPKVKPPPRAYCDICEMFDHETGDCQDNVTF